MSSASCIYEGSLIHGRTSPPYHFRHALAMWYVDLDELPALLGGRLVSSRPGVVRFRREDYYGDRGADLGSSVRDLVQARTGLRPLGPIRMLTHLRSWGHCFNPVTFYYCLDDAGAGIEALVAEVTNTPWRERHSYLVGPSGKRAGADATAEQTDRSSKILRGTFAKALHVSPFMAMDQVYDCRATVPDATLAVHIESREADSVVFEATLALRRRELDRKALLNTTARYPLATVRVLGLIYLHALRLRLAGARVFPHPKAGAP